MAGEISYYKRCYFFQHCLDKTCKRFDIECYERDKAHVCWAQKLDFKVSLLPEDTKTELAMFLQQTLTFENELLWIKLVNGKYVTQHEYRWTERRVEFFRVRTPSGEAGPDYHHQQWPWCVPGKGGCKLTSNIGADLKVVRLSIGDGFDAPQDDYYNQDAGTPTGNPPPDWKSAETPSRRRLNVTDWPDDKFGHNYDPVHYSYKAVIPHCPCKEDWPADPPPPPEGGGPGTPGGEEGGGPGTPGGGQPGGPVTPGERDRGGPTTPGGQPRRIPGPYQPVFPVLKITDRPVVTPLSPLRTDEPESQVRYGRQ